MPFCRLSEKAFMYDVTPVENLFIEEYMRHAPGEFVKVYIYALMFCYQNTHMDTSLNSIAKALDMDEKGVRNAFLYWERKGLIIMTHDSIEFINVKSKIDEGQSTLDTLYKYNDFNNNLQSLVPGRILSPQDYQRVYDWIEVFGLEQDAVLQLVGYCVNLKGEKISFAYMEKVACDWQEKGIRTLSAAEDFVKNAEALKAPVRVVLSHIGLNRTPTADEQLLYSKWRDWGFDDDAILAACGMMTRSRNPSLAYLDKVLEGLHDLGLRKTGEVRSYMEEHELLRGAASKAMYTLGMKQASPSPDMLSMLGRWFSDFDTDTILEVCGYLGRLNKRSFLAVDTLLKTLQREDVTGLNDVKAYIAELERQDSMLYELFSRAGLDKKPTEANRLWLKRVTGEYGYPFEVILYAAGLSMHARNKFTYIQKLLSTWHEKQLNTLEEIKSDKSSPPERGTTSKQLDGRLSDKNEYTKEELYSSLRSF